ncbi:hypothetical protein CYMTET_46959 [Cymbomonas tetramitiformis]|uniref:Potassium channel domain-containing protein n=1 Tax=Cymbomonas tetramitiformis TaxID=36881 RepID=A0AAE0EX24_9CHLO|nr:hypothetical protein CYMTET_46959 [Cymbomonas tetramitiformis]|eukprot:gene21079-25306_t
MFIFRLYKRNFYKAEVANVTPGENIRFYASFLLIFFLYYMVGCMFYSWSENWDTATCIYFITTSITTVGYGDYTLTDNSGRLFGIFYLTFGIVLIFGTLSQIAGSAVESFEGKYKQNSFLLDKSGRESVHRHRRFRVALSLVLLASFVLLGTVIPYIDDNYPFIEALWWSFQTVTTVGYGDIGIDEVGSLRKLTTSAFQIVLVAVVGAVLGNLTQIYSDMKSQRKLLSVAASLEEHVANGTYAGGPESVHILDALVEAEIVDSDIVTGLQSILREAIAQKSPSSLQLSSELVEFPNHKNKFSNVHAECREDDDPVAAGDPGVQAQVDLVPLPGKSTESMEYEENPSFKGVAET